MESNNNKIKNIAVFMLVLFSSFVVIQIHGYTVFLWLQILFCLLMIISKLIITFIQDWTINAVFLSMFLSMISGCISSMPHDYIKTSIVMPIMLVPLYFTVAYISKLNFSYNGVLRVIMGAFRVMCMVQIVWVLIQYICYHKFNLDINKLFFVDILHCVENATFIRSWVYYPSGLSWHSAVLAPLFLISLAIFDSKVIKLIVLIDVLICGNSTALLCVLCYYLVTIVWKLYSLKGKVKVNDNILIHLFFIFLIIILVCIIKSEMINTIYDKIWNLISRIINPFSDSSTTAHFSYYIKYPTVLKKSSIFQVLFGYGVGCSGYRYSQLLDIYHNITWSVESDIIDIIVSKGIIGFVIYYFFLFKIAIKGFKIDKRYFAVMIAIIIGGFGYNIQWDYVLFFAMIMYLAVKKEINIFDCKVFNIRKGLLRYEKSN